MFPPKVMNRVCLSIVMLQTSQWSTTYHKVAQVEHISHSHQTATKQDQMKHNNHMLDMGQAAAYNQ